MEITNVQEEENKCMLAHLVCRVRILREPREHLPILGNSHGLTVTFTGLIFPLSCNFLSRTGVPRHSAGGVGMFVRTYVRGT